jgi:hypothetical protein
MSFAAAPLGPPSRVTALPPPSADVPDVNPVAVVEPSSRQNFSVT